MFIPYMSSGLWTPARITTALWLDASNTSTITENITTPGNVSQWDDLSGNDNHAIQPSSGNQPIIVGNEITFDGVSDFFNLTSRITEARTVFSVCKWTDKTGDNRVIFGDTTSGGTFDWHGANAIDDTLLGTPSTIHIRNGSNYINGTLTAGLLERYTDETIYSFNTTGNVTIGTISLDRATSGRYFYGVYCEIIVVNTVLSNEDRQKTEGYLAWRHGLEGSLPIGHPYKDSAP